MIIPPQSKRFLLVVVSPPPLIFFYTNHRDFKTVVEANKSWIAKWQGLRLAQRCNKMEWKGFVIHLLYLNWDCHFQDF